jgi:hypothetical protein
MALPPLDLQFNESSPTNTQLIIRFHHSSRELPSYILLDRNASIACGWPAGFGCGSSFGPPPAPRADAESMTSHLKAAGYQKADWKKPGCAYITQTQSWAAVEKVPALVALVSSFTDPPPVATQTSHRVLVEYDLKAFAPELMAAGLSNMGAGASGGFGRVIHVRLGAMASPAGGAVKFFRALLPPMGNKHEVSAARIAVSQTMAIGLGFRHAGLLAIRGLVRNTCTGELVEGLHWGAGGLRL